VTKAVFDFFMFRICATHEKFGKFLHGLISSLWS